MNNAPQDLLLTKSDDGSYYDISLASDGDLATTDDLTSALITSLLADKRATEDEVKNPWLRGGWVGNLFLDRQIGSVLWLLKQASVTTEVQKAAIVYCQDALAWLTDEGFADKIDVTVAVSNQTALILVISIYKNGDTISEKVFNLWQNTLKNV